MKQKYVIALLLGSFIFCSCLDDVADPNAVLNFQTTALVLSEIENRGDYLNSDVFPAIKKASEIYSAMSNYLILDVRPEEKYHEGHLLNALNKSNNELFEYVVSLDIGSRQILLVSSTGQASAYYTSLFRLYGLKNVYSLEFGMSGWNKDFAYLIEDKLDDNDVFPMYDNISYPKPRYSKLPSLVKDDQVSINDYYTQRIKNLFEDGFDEDSYGYVTNVNTMDYQYFESLLSSFQINNFMLICFANPDLFFLAQLGLLDNPGHPAGTILYKIEYPVSELKSTSYLQTLKTDRTILLYSFSGQMSAMGVAYLNLIGYRAKSILFGAHNMFYSRLITSPALSPYAYNKYLINDFPYVKE